MWYPHFFKIALQSIRTIRQYIQPLNQATGAHDVSYSSKVIFYRQRANLVPASPRSRGIAIKQGRYGHCGELAMALQPLLMHNFQHYLNSIKCHRVNSKKYDHAFCLMEIANNIHQVPNVGMIYLEIDAWHPRIELITPGTRVKEEYIISRGVTVPTYCSPTYGESYLLADQYHNTKEFHENGGTTRRPTPVQLGEFENMHNDPTPEKFYPDYPIKEESLRKNFRMGLKSLDDYSRNADCQSAWDSIWNESQEIIPFYHQ